MERVYFSINESAAKTAHSMMSFSDYKEGSKTASDENAIEKLQEKVDELRETQEQMKEANKAIRLKDTKKGDELLRNMGYTDEQIKDLRTPDFCGRLGFPDYALTNNNANIRRLEGRIKSLQETKSKGTQESENKFFKVKEDISIAIYDPDSDAMFVGHTGVLIKYSDYYLFVEKIAFEQLYQATKVNNMDELLSILSLRPEYFGEEKEAGPFVYNNGDYVGTLELQG